jgi:hypothetical protein
MVASKCSGRRLGGILSSRLSERRGRSWKFRVPVGKRVGPIRVMQAHTLQKEASASPWIEAIPLPRK